LTGLRISDELSLPVEVAGEAIAMLAKRGAGKTNTATVLVEELDAQGVQVVVLDPVGAWWGLRSSADGKSAGISIAILGGQHGDVPLEPAAGALIADVVVDSGQSLVLDLSDFPSKAAVGRFVADFAERLFRRKARASSLLHLVLEEADLFAPQRVTGDAARMQGAIEQIVRRGRSRGIGMTMITQRSAVLSKDVLTQADVLVVMRTTGPHDQAAVKAWIDAHDDDQADVVDSLSSLQTGEAWIWNPERGVLKRVRIRRRRTFDSSGTPKAGERRADPKAAAAIDLTQLGAEIQATAERAKENDPAQLRKRTRELEEQLRRAMAAGQEPRTVVTERIVEVPVFAEGELDRLRDLVAEMARLHGEVGVVAENVWGAAQDVEKALERATSRKPETDPAPGLIPPASPAPAPETPRTTPPARPVPPGATPAEGVSGPQQRILNALAHLEAIGLRDASRAQVALFAEASPTSSTFTNNLGALKNEKQIYPWPPLVTYPSGGRVALTAEGRALANAAAAPQTVEEMHRYVYQLVNGPQGRILQELIRAYPEPLPRDELAARAGASPTSSTFTNNLGTLRSLKLIDKQPGVVTALPILFLEAA
jgi:uncharacterized protein